MAIILNNKKSTYSSPYAYYTVEVTEISNRQTDSVDLTLKITSNLATSSSKFGKGYTLKANLYAGSNWSSDIVLKASNDSWSGTAKHYKTQTITVNDLNANTSKLTNVKFRVVSSASDNAAGLNQTACDDIDIPIAHTPPTFTVSIQEQNSKLTNVGIANDVFVKNLSIKEITTTYTTYDNSYFAALYVDNKKDGGLNGFYWMSLINELIIDCTDKDLYKLQNQNKIALDYRLVDTKQGKTIHSFEYNYIMYEKPFIIENNTYAKRIGQLSGKAGITINGAYYKEQVGNETKTLKVYYKYWKNETTPTIPSTYTEIPTENITINNDGTFNVSNYQMGTDFDSRYSYRVKLKVEDNFSETETNEFSIPVGKSIWTEHKDYVDFDKLTIRKKEVFPIELMHATPTASISYISTNDTKFTLQKNVNVGSEFSISNGGILIGNNTTIIKINAQIWFSTGFNSGDSCRVCIYKNNDKIVEAGGRVGSANAYQSFNVSSKILEVQAGDIIYLYGRNATAGRGSSSAGEDTTYLTIEKIS